MRSLTMVVVLWAMQSLAQTHLLFAGGAHGATDSRTLRALQQRLEGLDAEHTVLVFTGNYTREGFPIEEAPQRAEAERAVLVHVEATREFVKRGGRVFFLPGHLDFPDGQTSTLRRLRTFLNRQYRAGEGDDLDVMPLKACGDDELIELSDDLGILLLNSQWWMQRDLDDVNANEGCSFTTREQLARRIELATGEYRARRLIVATHHPIQSLGPFGGHAAPSEHLTPAPVIGSVAVAVRELGFVEQYESSPLMRAWRDALRETARRYGSFVFVSGHDRSLQATRTGEQLQLIAGTTADDATPVTRARDDEFARSAPGWVELALDEKGEGAASFHVAEAPDAVFTVPLPPHQAAGPALETPPAPLPASPVFAKWTTTHKLQFPAPLKLVLGTFYTRAYDVEMPYPVLSLERFQVDRLGGGMQTNSLHLKDADGGKWAMRSLDKVATRVLPWQLGRSSFVTGALELGMTGINPEASVAVPVFADALGVLHPEPTLYFLADQPALGPYRSLFRDRVVALEQRPNSKAPGFLVPPDAKKVRSTDKVLEKIVESPWKHRVDAEAFLRARLLDLFLGDWDRHEDQWRWADVEEDGRHTYLPIALDRDQAMASYDGAGLFVARLMVPSARMLQPFDGQIHSLADLTRGARHLDRAILNSISRERWAEIAADVQAELTDARIDEALARWHREAFELDGARVTHILRARRDRLRDFATAFYEQLALDADVVASEKDDELELTWQPHGAVHVVLRHEHQAYFERTFDPDDTRELRVYGLDGDDHFTISGAGPGRIDVRLIGGRGDDRFDGVDQPRGIDRLQVYDMPGGATIDPQLDVDDERSTQSALNHYDVTENHDPDELSVSPRLVINPDVGSFYGVQVTGTVQGWKKHPFAAQHQVGAAVFTATPGLALDYRGDFPRSIAWRLDQTLEGLVRTPTDTRNFFGYTNRYVGSDIDSAFYRVLQSRYEGRYTLSYDFEGSPSRVGVQAVGAGFITEAPADRFVSISRDVRPDALGTRVYGGLRLFAQTNTFDDAIRPTQGAQLGASVEGRDEVRGGQLSMTARVVAAAAIPFDRERRVVFLTRGVVEGIVGPHPFFLAPTLGAPLLRAYRYNQFTGNVAFAHSNDLRIDVLRFTRGVPGSLGIDLSADYGRVFDTPIPSTLWHLSLGGGLWWCPFDRFAVSVSYHRALDGADRFSFALGSLFPPLVL